MASTAVTPPHRRLLHDDATIGATAATPRAAALLALVLADTRNEETSEEEVDDVHNAKSKAGLEHAAVAICIHANAVDLGITLRIVYDAHLVVRTARDGVARVLRNEAELIDGCDERSHEAEVDEGYKDGIPTRTMVGEEGEYRIECRQHHRDKHEDNVSRC